MLQKSQGKHKKVLITGGAGFIGSNLVRKLLSTSGFEVFVIENEAVSLWRLKDVENEITVKYVDLKKEKEVREVIGGIRPDVVFHLASYGVDREFRANEREMRLVNVGGTLNLALALNNNFPEIFVYVNTSLVYAPKDTKLKETDLVAPLDMYAATKYEAEEELQKIAREKGMSLIIARLFTSYGYYDGGQRLIPYIILNALRSELIDLLSPANVRDFIFIEDTLDFFIKVIGSNQSYQDNVFNVGSGQQQRIADIIGVVEKILGKKLEVSYRQESSSVGEPKNFIADISRAKEIFDWEPQHNFEQGLAKTIEWFKKNKDLYKINNKP